MSNDFTPPTASTMQQAQNSEPVLTLLVAQRLLYNRAKRYLAARLIGMFMIAVLTPVIGGVWPSTAVVCGSVAGLWIFLGRTWLTSRQRVDVDRAAAVQDSLDGLIYGMPAAPARENAPSLEDVDKLTGGSAAMRRRVREDKLADWYPFKEAAGTDAFRAVAMAQRANVSYSDSLLRTTARVWRLALSAWVVIAVVLCFVLKVEFKNVLMIVFLPVLPAFLDITEFTRSYEDASYIRATTAREIEVALAEGHSPGGDQLRVWQERIYNLRRTTPLVPETVYWLSRKSNERAMKSAARRLVG